MLYPESLECTLATEPIVIATGAAETLEDGEYWIIADNKVATPLTKNYGYLDVVDAVGGKSTAANAFTFTQVDAGLYTIQDSNGKYYYQTGNYNSFNVADEDGMTDEFLWEVYDSGNGMVIQGYGAVITKVSFCALVFQCSGRKNKRFSVSLHFHQRTKRYFYEQEFHISSAVRSDICIDILRQTGSGNPSDTSGTGDA